MRARLGKYVQKPELVFLILASIFGILSAFIVPQLSIPDENMHLLREYTIVSGNLAGDDDNKCTFPKEVYDRAYSIYDGDYDSHFSQKIDPNVVEYEWCGTAASYSPLVYVPQVVGIAIAKLIHPSTGLMILLGRLASIMFYVAAVYYIIKKVRIGKWAFAVIALLPIAIQQAASLSADGVTFVATFAMVAFLLNLASQKVPISRRQIIILLLLSAALVLTKVPNVLLLLIIPFLPSRLFNIKFNKSSPLLRATAVKWYVFFAAVIFAILCTLVWQKIYGQPLVHPAADNPIPHHPWQFIPLLFRTYIYIDPQATIYGFTGLGGFGDFIMSGVVGGFASYRYWLPQILIFTCYALILFTLLRSNKAEDKLLDKNSGRLALGGILSLGALIVGVTYSLYVMWALPLLGPGAPYVAGVQGRYFTAALVMLIPAGVWLRRHVSIVVRTDILYAVIIASVCCFLLLFYTLQTLYAIHLGEFR